MLKTVGFPSTRIGDQTIDNGNIVIGTAGKGIDFSAASHAAGMTSELLNDYEEGTWTPSANDSEGHSFAAAIAVGRYVKVGSQVTASCNFTWSSKGSANASPMIVAGLPFASSNATNMANGASIGLLNGFDTVLGTKQITFNLGANRSFLTVHQTNDNAAQTDLPANAQSATGGMTLTVTYIV